MMLPGTAAEPHGTDAGTQDAEGASLGRVWASFRATLTQKLARVLIGLTRMTARDAGVRLVWASSVLASMSTLDELAGSYGEWGHFAPLLPLSVDVYWLTALHVAADQSLPMRRRLMAWAHVAVALSASVAGNLIYHELRAGVLHVDRHGRGAMVAAIAAVPFVTGAALAHLLAVARPAVPPAGVPAVPARSRATPVRKAAAAPAPAALPRPDRAALPAPAVPPAVPGAPDAAGPGAASVPPDAVPEGGTAAGPAAVPPGEAAPPPLKRSGHPDPAAVEAARQEWHRAVRAGQIHSPRSLCEALRVRYGHPVLGRTAAASVISEERGQQRRPA